MSSSDRKMVQHRVCTYEVEEFFPEGFFDLDKLERFVADLKKAHDPKHHDVSISFKLEHYGYDGCTEIAKYVTRPETDAEYNKRLKAEAAQAAAKKKKEEREYKKYLELKKKFG